MPRVCDCNAENFMHYTVDHYVYFECSKCGKRSKKISMRKQFEELAKKEISQLMEKGKFRKAQKVLNTVNSMDWRPIDGIPE